MAEDLFYQRRIIDSYNNPHRSVQTTTVHEDIFARYTLELADR
jgi:hypothetical protein